MKLILFILFLFSLKAAQSLTQASTFVRELNPEQVPIIRRGVWVVSYYNPKSQASQQFAAQFLKAAKLLKPAVKFAAIGVSSQTSDISISSYPLIRLYADGKVLKQGHPQRAGDIVTFVKSWLPQIVGLQVQSTDAKSNSKSLLKTTHNKRQSNSIKDKKISSISQSKTPQLKYESNFRSPFQIANPLPMTMQIISNRIISEKE